MKYLVYVLLTFLLVACNINDRRTGSVKASDSSNIAGEIKDKIKLKDSPDFFFKDEGRIIGPILFGMNSKECRRAEDSFERSTLIKTEHGSEYDHALGAWSFHNGHHYYWKDDKVYGMVLEGSMILPKDYRIQARINADELVAAISKEYGEPDIYNEIPKQNNVEVNGDFDLATWNIGKKRIVAAIHNSGSTFYTLLNIYRPETYPH